MGTQSLRRVDRRQVVARVAVDPLVVRVDTDELRRLIDDHGDRLLAGLDALAQNAVRESFGRQIEILQERLVDSLREYATTLNNVTASPDLKTYIELADTTDPAQLKRTQSLLGVLLERQIQVPNVKFTGLRYLSANGQQLAFAVSTQTGSTTSPRRRTSTVLSQSRLFARSASFSRRAASSAETVSGLLGQRPGNRQS